MQKINQYNHDLSAIQVRWCVAEPEWPNGIQCCARCTDGHRFGPQTSTNACGQSASMWNKRVWVQCWSLYSQQVSHQRWTWGSLKWETVQGIHSCFETQGRHHQKSKQGYQWPHKKEQCPPKIKKKLYGAILLSLSRFTWLISHWVYGNILTSVFRWLIQKKRPLSNSVVILIEMEGGRSRDSVQEPSASPFWSKSNGLLFSAVLPAFEKF